MNPIRRIRRHVRQRIDTHTPAEVKWEINTALWASIEIRNDSDVFVTVTDSKDEQITLMLTPSEARDIGATLLAAARSAWAAPIRNRLHP